MSSRRSLNSLWQTYQLLTGDADEVGRPDDTPYPANQEDGSCGELEQSNPSIYHDNSDLVGVYKTHLWTAAYTQARYERPCNHTTISK